jgi:prefoldin alpha subunit
LSPEKKRLADKSEQELRKLIVEMRILEQTADTIQARLNMVNAVLTDLSLATMALETLEKEKADTELLVPVGGNSYVQAKLGSTDRIIVGIGAGVSIERTLPEAKEIIKKRLEDVDKNRITLQQQFNQVAQKMNEDRETYEALMSEAREGKPTQNV